MQADLRLLPTFRTFIPMLCDPLSTVAFTGHRTCLHEADGALWRAIEALHDRGLRTFLSGMAVGFDLAAAEAVLACRERLTGLRLVAVVPFEGQDARFSAQDRLRFRHVLAAADERVVLAPAYFRGCYAVRNDYLVEHAAHFVAWYDGSPGGTHYTVLRALRRGRRVDNLCPAGPPLPAPAPTLF